MLLRDNVLIATINSRWEIQSRIIIFSYKVYERITYKNDNKEIIYWVNKFTVTNV